MSAAQSQTPAVAGFYTDDNGIEWLCVERNGKVEVAQADKATMISKDLFEQWGWRPVALVATDGGTAA